MRYFDFESIMSIERMDRYRKSCNGSPKKAMTLYRKNLNLSQELFTVISCFEVALRNKIDRHYILNKGQDWLLNAAKQEGFFDNQQCRISRGLINDSLKKLNDKYSHAKLVAAMDFGFWRYLFSQPQFYAGGQTLLQIFPAKPKSSPAIQYNHTFVFNELSNINNLRNRIAHHEPICFLFGQNVKSTIYARQHYALISQLFQWMSIDEAALLYGLDHINTICKQIDDL